MAAKVLTVASTKGGAGKTTIVMALAGTLAAEGLRIAVVDADPNRACASWAEGAYEGSPVAVRAEADEARLAEARDELAPGADLVLVDTAGFGNRAALLAMADAVLVPCTPSRADVEQATKTLQLVEGAARAARRAIPARVVPSRLKHATAVSRHAMAELDAAAFPGWPLVSAIASPSPRRPSPAGCRQEATPGRRWSPWWGSCGASDGSRPSRGHTPPRKLSASS
jgi:chromosome partitioning protein